MRRYLVPVIVLIVALLFTGCAVQCDQVCKLTYKKRWERAAWKITAGKPPTAWKGRWTSESNASGKLWCILEDRPPSEFKADFRAEWHSVFASQHTAYLKRSGPASRTKKVTRFEGGATLHTWIGSGSYTCKGFISGNRMRARYDSKYDCGTFDLVRVP